MKIPKLPDNVKVHTTIWRKIKEISISDMETAGNIVQRIVGLGLDPLPMTDECESETVWNLTKKNVYVKRLKCVDISDYRIFYAYKKSGMVCVLHCSKKRRYLQKRFMALPNYKASLYPMEGMSMNLISEKIKYTTPKPDFRWQMPPQAFPALNLYEICDTCDSIKDKEIERLKSENKKLKKLAEFLRNEVKSLELKTALTEKAMPLKNMVDELTSTPEGKRAWEKAWEEQFNEWQELVRQGKMSRIKYHRLINGIDQKTLAKKLDTAQPNISRIEKLGYNVPTRTLKKLAKIFGVKMEDLIGD